MKLTKLWMIAVAAAAGCLAGAWSGQAGEGRLQLSGGELAYRFLWPANEAAPGSDLRELTAEEGAPVAVDTPLGPATATLITLRLASGETAAVSRVLAFNGHEGVYVFETEIKRGITAPTGKFEVPHFALPALRISKSYDRVLNFQVEEFVTPVHRPIPTTGPIVLFNKGLEVVVISPLDNFMDAMTAPVDGEWRAGFGGLIEDVPAGATHKVLVVAGHGINDTFTRWGGLIQTWHGHRPAAPDSDLAMSHLGYWTDNGSYYYYRTEPGENYHQTLLGVKEYADRAGIPYAYFQIDSWWYPKARIPDFSSKYRGGFLLWEPEPDLFPAGLAAFDRELGLPLVAHNRYAADQSPYCDKYKCVYGDDPKKQGALPIDPAFWDEIMDNAVSYGVVVYEQDWLYTHMGMIPWLRQGLGNAASWYDGMASAAARRGLTMQLCMASPEFMLQQLKHNNATHARVSHDYKGGLAKSFFWVPFHEASLFSHAVGLWPFKDNFQSSSGQRATYMLVPENSPFEEALIAALSGGPIGPSDRIGYSDRDLILRTCRSDGLLLKPDRPATPLDIMWLGNNNMVLGGNKPWIVHTWSDHEIGRTYYLSAFNIWPARMIDPSVSLGEAGIGGDYIIYDWRDRRVLGAGDKINFGLMKPERAYYYALCPRLGNGMALIGEPEKFITVSAQRFPVVELAGDALRIKVAGAPDEIVTVAVWCEQAPTAVTGADLVPVPAVISAGLIILELKIPASGKTNVELK